MPPIGHKCGNRVATKAETVKMPQLRKNEHAEKEVYTSLIYPMNDSIL